MASAGQEDELECSICLNIFTDPIIVRCGHNFCRVCIDQHLNTQDGSGGYSCPECRAKFQERPALIKNITLCKIVENFRSTPHTKCSIHKKMLEYYCMEDAACICASCCLIGEHRGHQVESLDEASEKKKKKLRIVLQKLITKRKKTEKRVQSLEERRRKAQDKSSGEAERVTALFIDIRRHLDDLEKRILSEISRQEEQMSLSLPDVIQKLEIKKDELSRNMRNIEKLCNMTDPLTVLQEPDTGDLCDPEDEESDEDTGGHDGGDRCAELISHISHTFQTLSDIIRDVNVTFYGQETANILLDVNTAHSNLLISDDLKTATWTNILQNRPETALRFRYYQVMSSKRFSSGRHYWDVEINGSWRWRVGMCYSSIDRRGQQSYIGDNYKSWCLHGGLVYNNQYSVIHDSKKMKLLHQISSDRVRICLDYEAGQLSFYELCDPIRHLHTFTDTFSEPLHAALWVCDGSIKILGGAAAEVKHHSKNLIERLTVFFSRSPNKH